MNEKVVFDDPVRKSVFLNIKSALSRINNIRLLEKPLYSDELKLAGTPDAISDFDNDLAVIDFKTSNKIKKRIWIVHHFLQAACYAVMYNEHFKTMPQKAVIIMAVENERQPVVYIEPMRGCILALREFIKDPIQFQKDVLKG
jgi:genome maintenance exonuclease 1